MYQNPSLPSHSQIRLKIKQRSRELSTAFPLVLKNGGRVCGIFQNKSLNSYPETDELMLGVGKNVDWIKGMRLQAQLYGKNGHRARSKQRSSRSTRGEKNPISSQLSRGALQFVISSSPTPSLPAPNLDNRNDSNPFLRKGRDR